MREPEARRLFALEDCFGEVRRDEGEVQDAADMLTLLLEPYCERLDRACLKRGARSHGPR